MVAKRLPFVALAMLCLLTGLWTGLSRIGWDIYVLKATAHHGAVMVGGFLGTLISLEKIIPLKRKALFLIPAISAGSVIAFLFQVPAIAMMMLVIASAGFCAVIGYYLFRHRDLVYILMFPGAVCWLMGNIFLYSELFYPVAFPWWVGFALFVIISERIEIMRFLPVSANAKTVLVAMLALYAVSIFFSFHGFGNVIAGIALVGVSTWLMQYDLVGVTIRKSGLTQYVAVALLCGYAAMLLCGVFFLTLNNIMAYDALVHTFFIGFVFSMIFAHGPIILPGVLGILAKPFHRTLYVWLALLQLSWILRITGDVLLIADLRMLSGILTATAIVAYFITMAFLTFSHKDPIAFHR